jgi:hypothetical protein
MSIGDSRVAARDGNGFAAALPTVDDLHWLSQNRFKPKLIRWGRRPVVVDQPENGERNPHVEQNREPFTD